MTNESYRENVIESLNYSKYNDDLKNYLRKNQLQFAVLDDNALFTGN